MPQRIRPPRRPSPQHAATARPQFVEVRGRTGRLWCRIDPVAQTAEFRRGTMVEVIDLTRYIKAGEEE